MSTPIRLLALSLPLAAGLVACQEPPKPQEEIRAVRTVIIADSPQGNIVRYGGELRAREEAALGFRVAGKLARRAVNVGERVQKGQLLAIIDGADYQLANTAGNSQRLAAEAQLRATKGDLDRMAELVGKGYVSQSEYDRQRAAVDAARAQVAALAAQSEQLGNQSQYTRLLADADGVVTAVLAESGQVLAAGQPVFKVARSGALEAAIAVPEDHIDQMRAGLAAQAEVWALPKLGAIPATVREVGSAADPYTRTFPVRVSIPNPPEGLQLGMTTTVQFSLGAPPVPQVPINALITQGGKPGVWVVGAQDSRVHLRAVKPDGVAGNELRIVAGLQPGDVVVTAGAAFLREGQKVRAIGAPGA